MLKNNSITLIMILFALSACTDCSKEDQSVSSAYKSSTIIKIQSESQSIE